MLQNIGQVLPAASARFGDKTALVCDGRTFSFRELDLLSARMARSLCALGVSPGDRVTLYGPNGWEWIVTYYAIARAGAVINPVNAMLTADEVRFVIDNCGASVLVVSSDKAVAVAQRRPSTLREIVVYGDDASANSETRSFEALLGTGHGDHTLNVPAGNPVQDARPEDLSTICYTSGTTGFPKGAMQSHRSVVLNAAMTATMHVRTASDTVVHALPLPHVYGTIVMNSALLYGLKLVLLERFTPAAALRAIQEHRATIFDGVPTMYLYMLNAPELAATDVSSLTRCTVGGQSMPLSSVLEVEARFGCPVLEAWGMTELAGIGTSNTALGPNRHGSIGVPIPYVSCRIADLADASRTMPAGDVGELMIRGPIVMDGYFNDPATTLETIEPDGWMHTGDLARMDSDGFISIVDRKKDVILSGGYNVYPAEIERVIAQHPAVAMVAVGSLPDQFKGEVARAYVVCRSDSSVTEAEILSLCGERLAAYKLPRSVQFVEDLPKTSTGKILRRMLPTLESNRQMASAALATEARS
jgi:long-chain acyl-CoA synthetase